MKALLLSILLTTQFAFSIEGGDVGNGSGGEVINLPTYDNEKINQALELIRSRLIETNIPENLSKKILDELESLKNEEKLLEIPAIFYLGQNSGCNTQHFSIQNNQVVTYDACTTTEEGSVVYITSEVGNDIQKLAETLLPE